VLGATTALAAMAATPETASAPTRTRVAFDTTRILFKRKEFDALTLL
jgi:hypothetical protein